MKEALEARCKPADRETGAGAHRQLTAVALAQNCRAGVANHPESTRRRLEKQLAVDRQAEPPVLSAEQPYAPLFMDALVSQWGRIDILVNNAGITQPLKIMEIAPENYDAVLDVNLRGTLYCSQAVIPHMRSRKQGKIVNLSSVSAQRGGGIFGGPHYSAAKAGVLGLTKAMARELAPDNVRVNAICPGFIATDITGGLLTPEKLEEIKAGIPMGRPGTADDVAGCALFLASDLSAYVTGSEVDVNGGSLIH
ncbi:SDR family NAD(P)-dependent oxidoreductase [Sinorhizobium meliloti]|uniref:SDR family NAD(P)-dependent oxidoreductase n=1 Tax=Rhizobium meliloti TaxID=382 RepID=UPI003988FC72